jgi:hypothetical protein
MRMHRFTAAIVGVTLALGIGIAQAHDEKGIPSKGEKPERKALAQRHVGCDRRADSWDNGPVLRMLTERALSDVIRRSPPSELLHIARQLAPLTNGFVAPAP